MTPLIRMELRKALQNPWFYLSLGIACALSAVSAFGNIAYHQQHGVFELYTHKYVSPVPDSCFKWWISLDFLQPASTLLYQLLPLLAVIPYTWSYRTELQSGYIAQVITRARRRPYLIAKELATFISGSLVAVLPLVANFIILAAFIPAYTPDITEVLYLGVYPDDQWSWFFYNLPLAYVLLFTLHAAGICGTWALFVFTLSFLVENRVTLIAAPYLGALIIQFLSERLYLALGSINGPQLGLAPNMRAGVESYPQIWWVIALECGLLLLTACVLTKRQLLKDQL